MKKIQFTSLLIKNTLCFEHVCLDLNNHELSIIEGENLDDGGSNGSGKSSLVKIFYYAVTGITPEGLKTEDILSDFNIKDSLVALTFNVDGEEYQISRYRNHHKYDNKLILNQIVNKKTVDVSCHKAPDTQKKIYDLLQLDPITLLLLTIFSTETIHFARSKPAERRQMFVNLFPNIQIYPYEYAIYFKNKKFEILKTYSDLETKKIIIETNLNNMTSSIESIQESIKVIKEEKDSNTTERENELQILLTKRALLSKELKILKNNLIKTIKNKQEFGVTEENIITMYNDNSNSIENKKGEAALLKIELDMLGTKIARLSDAYDREVESFKELKNIFKDGECITCGTMLDIHKLPEKLISKINTLKQKGMNLKVKMIEQRKKEYSLRAKYDNMMKEVTDETVQLDELYNLTTMQSKIKDIIKQLDDIDIKILYLKENIGNVKTQNEDLEEKLVELSKTEEKLKQDYAEITSKLIKLENTKNMLDYIIKISTVDIPTYLLNSYLVTLEQETSEILSKLFPGMSVLLTDTAISKKGAEKPELYLEIQNSSGHKREYAALSGAEKQMVNISLLFGIQHTIEQKTGCSINVLWLDEILDLSSDDLRSSNVLSFLKEETKYYDSIFLISHKKINKEITGNKIIISKHNGISSIKQ